MAKKKTKSINLENSMQGLVAGIVPTGANYGKGSSSANKINATESLGLQVRSEFITLNYVLLSRLYQQFGLVQSLVEVPVLDAFRGGLKFSGYEKKLVETPVPKKRRGLLYWLNNESEEKPAQKSEAELKKDFDIEQMKKREQWGKDQLAKDKELEKTSDEYFRQEITREEIRMMELYLQRNEVWQKYQQSIFWKRLFGGGALVIFDGKDPATELKLEDINQDTELEFYPTDCWELSNTRPDANELATVDWLDPRPFSIRGHKIHKSRVIVLKGKDFPPLYRSVGRGWGMSILESLVRTLNKSIKNENVIFELLDEAKMDVVRFYGLNDALQDEEATEAITRRVGYATQTKNYMKTILLDKEDEYAQKQIHFNGLCDLKIDSRVDAASDARITMNKLYGTSPAGFNSGDADRETYADTVEADIRIPCTPGAIRILEVVGRKVLGKTLDFDVKWESLIRTTEYDIEKLKTLRLANLNEANVFGRITNKEWQEAVNKYDLLGIDVTYKEEFVADPMARQVFKPGFGGR